MTMEEIAFSDWPGSPVDLNSGNNPWMPAYGFQTPSALLEKEDFLGNPDAEYFLQGNVSQYVYLETIQEETSDDLRSESDMESRPASPVAGWLATDSETGSVICIDAYTDEMDCDSDRELACPSKRRKHDGAPLQYLTVPEDDLQSLSRSSSLLQFETLEKQCQQETCSVSPSVNSQFSFDSLELRKNGGLVALNSPTDSLADDEDSSSSEYYKSLKIDVPLNGNSYEDCSEGSDEVKTWRSLEGLHQISRRVKKKVSVENLSEDSGYSGERVSKFVGVGVGASFPAYDGDVFNNFQGNFGVSYHDLSSFDGVASGQTRPLVDIFMRNKQAKVLSSVLPPRIAPAKISCDSAPNLHRVASEVSLFEEVAVNTSSVPKDLNLVGEATTNPKSPSVAVQNLDMSHYRREGSYAEAMSNRVDLSDDEQSLCYKPQPKTTISMFDKQVLRAISESSLANSTANSTTNINYNPNPPPTPPNIHLEPLPKRSLTLSTPNLSLMRPYFEEDPQERHNSLHNIRKSSTSDADDKTLTSLNSNNSKGVHFSPVVSEVNWHDDSSVATTATVEHGSDSSFTVSSGRDETPTPPTPPRTIKFQRLSSASPMRRGRSVSQPDLSDNDQTSVKREFVDSLRSLRKSDISKSQPEVSRFKRRGSQLIKKDQDGCVIKAYVDGDGIQYKHTHLDLDINHGPTSTTSLTSQDHGSGGEHAAAAFGHASRSTGALFTSDHHSFPQQQQHQLKSRPVGAMEPYDAHRIKEGRAAVLTTATAVAAPTTPAGSNNNNRKQRPAGKIGGFFSRLASFRFSAPRKSDKQVKKKNLENTSKNAPATALQPHQRVATKDDYIYIPLKSPTASSTPNRPANSSSPMTSHYQVNTSSHHPHNNNLTPSKPPLPRQPPPRVVHASVKKDHQYNQGRAAPEEPSAPSRHRHRRRTIDSGHPMDEPMGLIETDLDTEVTVITGGGGGGSAAAKTRSLLNLGATGGHSLAVHQVGAGGAGGEQPPPPRPHKSMEFLLDKQNLKVVEPPENELQKTERVMSEHQLRVQRSLQKLTVPDWFKQAQLPREGFLLKKHSNREHRWQGTGSKTTSLNSLTSSQQQSPLVLSPLPTNAQPFVRWSTSKLNSTASSPCASTRSSFNTRQPNGSISPASSVRSSFSYRQPYLGWRSQERLARPRTPAERLASTILTSPLSTPDTQQQEESPEIQTSIKEVTSAIVHYVSGLRPDSDPVGSQRSLSASPRGSQKFCWLESSFVGTKPLDSPQTPITLSESQTNGSASAQSVLPPVNLRLELQSLSDVALPEATGTTMNVHDLPTGTNILSAPKIKPSPSSTTLEDVLDSLLGLPSSGRAPSPSLQGRRPVDGVS